MKMDIEYYNDQWKRDPNGLNFRGVKDVEIDGSQFISRAWFKIVSAWGNAAYTAWFDVRDGKGVSNTGKQYATASDNHEIPATTRMVRIEGRRDNAATLVSASILLGGK